MELNIDNNVFEKFPGLNIGVVVAKEINNSKTIPEIQEWIKREEERIKTNYDTGTLSQNPRVDVWRKAYSAFGAKPKDNKSSVESLYCSVLSGRGLRPINCLVDIYNLISLKHMLPVGGEDTDKTQGDIALTFAGADEAPVLLLGDQEAKPPHEGEVIYKDDVSAICRRWNWREADRTKFTEKTKNCVLVIEGLPPITREDVETAVGELVKLAQAHCGGTLSCSILDKDNSSVEF